ncbi:2TM domain-containing protein [Ramlibacter sp.]|uniref:2TM domain-containing protein n=1 Tax=Ramlibacter sp. TaxID=1917967 RepID=UPI0017B8E2A1|nr:2TM domain-containing protein [Ramlibacter sp.]MBA2673000.1 2TM domain-containing protein [Ramlibacter sp.]
MQSNQQTTDLERTARRRAGAKMGWYIHATVFLAVNALLMLLSFMAGRHWAIYPAFGWGIGLAVHGLVVFLVTGGGGLHQRLVERERVALQRDTW